MRVLNLWHHAKDPETQAKRTTINVKHTTLYKLLKEKGYADYRSPNYQFVYLPVYGSRRVK